MKGNLAHKILRITRFKDHVGLTIWGLTPLFFSSEHFKLTDYLFLYVLFLSNIIYGFVINDYYDIENDRLSGKKTVIDLKYISEKGIILLSITMLFISLALSLLKGFRSFVFILLISILSFIYSAKPIRLKENSPLEFPVVILAFGPLFILYSAIFIIKEVTLPSMLLFVASSMQVGESQIYNCFKDFSGDKKAGNRNLLQVIGESNAIILWVVLALVFILSITLLFFVKQVYVLVPFGIIFLIYSFMKCRTFKSAQQFMYSRKLHIILIVTLFIGIVKTLF